MKKFFLYLLAIHCTVSFSACEGGSVGNGKVAEEGVGVGNGKVAEGGEGGSVGNGKTVAFSANINIAKEGGNVGNGKAAPNFTAKDQDGKTVSLSQYKGKKVVLYFYPKDDTPGCTAEACNLRDNYDSLANAGYTILGVSTDGQASHANFKSKYNLPFTLVADVDTSINKQYKVWVEKEKDGQKHWGTARTTFIIDEKGIIVNKIDKVDTKQHAQQVLSFHAGQ